MRWSLVLLVSACCSVVHAIDHPAWDSLAKLYDLPKDSKEVTSFVRAHGLSGVSKGPSGSFSADDQSYSLLYRRNQICTIKLRVSTYPDGYGEKHWKPYSGTLPGKLSPHDGRANVIKKLGATVQSRNNTWRCGTLYIWVHFDSKQESIDELFISPRVIEAAR
jgi:hypothetical protein